MISVILHAGARAMQQELPLPVDAPASSILWLLNIFSPIVLIYSAAKFIDLRAETRLRQVNRTISSLNRLLPRRASGNAVPTHLGHHQGNQSIARRLSTKVPGCVVLWTLVRLLIAPASAERRRNELKRNRRYLKYRKLDYEAQSDDDKEAGRKFIAEGWSRIWGVLVDKDVGKWVAVGVLVTAVVTAAAWMYESTDTVPLSGVRFVGIILILVMFVIHMSNRRGQHRRGALYFTWGCVIVVSAGLATLERSAFRGSPLEREVDAQTMTAMFLAVGVVLALCEALSAVGSAKDIGNFERSVIRQSARLRVASRLTSGLVGRLRVGEGLLVLGIMSSYVLFGHQVMYPIVESVWCGDMYPPLPGATAVLGVTIGVLTLPVLVLAIATSSRGIMLCATMVPVMTYVTLGTMGDQCFRDEEKRMVNGKQIVEREIPKTDEEIVNEFAIHFDLGDATLTPVARDRLQDVAGVLRRNPEWFVCITGHADERGEPEVNNVLGRSRALVVLEFLVEEENLDMTFEPISFGENRPALTDRSMETRWENRRVEVRVGKEGADTCGRADDA